MMEALAYIAHVLLAAPFLASGVEKALNPAAALREVTTIERRVPLPIGPKTILVAVVAAQLTGAALLLVPPLAGYGALLLMAFLAPTTLIAHPFWAAPPRERAAMRNHFLLNVALIGGLTLVAARSWP